MDRREILADRPVEKGRGFMPGVSVNPSRVLFTAGLTGRGPDGNLVAGGMAAQTRRTFERLQSILGHVGAKFDDTVKQLVYVTDIDAYNAVGRAERAKFFGSTRAASTGLVVRRLADPAMLIEVELVVDLPGVATGKPLLEKFNVALRSSAAANRSRGISQRQMCWHRAARRRRSTRTSATCSAPPVPPRPAW